MTRTPQQISLWYPARNGRQIDIYVRVKPDGEAPRVLTIAQNVPEEDAELIAVAPQLLAAAQAAAYFLDALEPILRGASETVPQVLAQLRAAISIAQRKIVTEEDSA